jgi:hypothetical protein
VPTVSTRSAANPSILVIASRLRPVQPYLPNHHKRQVPDLAEKLRHLLPGACQLRPAGFGLRVLSQPPNLFSVENEIDLSQFAAEALDVPSDARGEFGKQRL